MKEEEFFKKMVELLDTDDEITMDSVLKDIEEWDSLSFVSFLAMADVSAGKKLEAETVKKAQTIGDLFDFVKD